MGASRPVAPPLTRLVGGSALPAAVSMFAKPVVKEDFFGSPMSSSAGGILRPYRTDWGRGSSC